MFGDLILDVVRGFLNKLLVMVILERRRVAVDTYSDKEVSYIELTVNYSVRMTLITYLAIHSGKLDNAQTGVISSLTAA